jgi:hypothetical protein
MLDRIGPPQASLLGEIIALVLSVVVILTIPPMPISRMAPVPPPDDPQPHTLSQMKHLPGSAEVLVEQEGEANACGQELLADSIERFAVDVVIL